VQGNKCGGLGTFYGYYLSVVDTTDMDFTTTKDIVSFINDSGGLISLLVAASSYTYSLLKKIFSEQFICK